MQYRSQFHARRRSPRVTGTVVVIALIIVAIAGLFACGIWWFRFRPKPSTGVAAANTIANVMSPTAVSAADLAASTSGTAREATLRDVSGGSATGTAIRETVDGQLLLKTKASSLPPIDPEKESYEGWLVRQVPYDFVSVGSFVGNEDGTWGLEWAGAAGKYDGYIRVVVTREPKDGNPDPSGHVLEGEFK